MLNSKFLSLIFAFNIFLIQFSVALDIKDSKVVAKINDKTINYSEYREFHILEYLFDGKLKSNQVNEVDKEILKKLIDEYLLMEKAKSYNVKVSDSELDYAYKSKLNSFTKADFNFARFLKFYKISENSYKDYLLRKLYSQKFSLMLFERENIISEIEVREFFEQKRIPFYNDKYHIIAYKITSSEKVSETLYNNLKNKDKEAENLIKKFESIDFGSVYLTDLNQEIAEHLKDLNVGEYSMPIKIEDINYIYKVKSIKKSKITTDKESDNIKQYIMMQRIDNFIKGYLIDLRNDSYIKTYI